MNTGIEIRQDLIADPAGEARMGRSAGADFHRDRKPALRAQTASAGLSVFQRKPAPD